jgi:hypothetical protein
MTNLSETILKDWQVRKTRQQKSDFIEFMKGEIPELTVEEGGTGKNRNLIVGDVRSAKIILTAHYDTCAKLPFPNFIAPKNKLLSLGYGMLIAIPFIILTVILEVLFTALFDNAILAFYLSYFPSFGLMFWMLMGGKPNPHTVNDNTSGVIQLIEIMSALTEDQRKQVAFVFFDNEENGLLGSAYFAKLHKKDGMKEKLILNYDCVSDGDNFLFVISKTAQERFGEALAAAFPSTGEKISEIVSNKKAMYPSDQKHFTTSVAVAALKNHPRFGLYLDKIHTKHDTNFDTRNMEYLTQGTLRFLDAAL